MITAIVGGLNPLLGGKAWAPQTFFLAGRFTGDPVDYTHMSEVGVP